MLQQANQCMCICSIIDHCMLTPYLYTYLLFSFFRDKAGGYGMQGIAGQFISGIEGCYYNVVGLPLYAFAKNLRKFLQLDNVNANKNDNKNNNNNSNSCKDNNNIDTSIKINNKTKTNPVSEAQLETNIDPDVQPPPKKKQKI